MKRKRRERRRALHAAAKLVANGISRSALAVFSGRQNLLCIPDTATVWDRPVR